MDQRFVSCFVVVTGLLAAAGYLSRQALAQHSLLVAAPAAVAGLVAIVGFITLARVVFLTERARRQQ